MKYYLFEYTFFSEQIEEPVIDSVFFTFDRWDYFDEIIVKEKIKELFFNEIEGFLMIHRCILWDGSNEQISLEPEDRLEATDVLEHKDSFPSQAAFFSVKAPSLRDIFRDDLSSDLCEHQSLQPLPPPSQDAPLSLIDLISTQQVIWDDETEEPLISDLPDRTLPPKTGFCLLSSIGFHKGKPLNH